MGGEPTKLDSAPDWYEQTKTSSYFTNRDTPPESAAPAPESRQTSPSGSGGGMIGGRRTYKAPDGSAELILREDPSDPDDRANGEKHGKHYVLRYLKTGIQADFGTLPGFFGAYEMLHERQNPDRRFLLEGLLRVAFFGLHLNSTDGDTSFALDLNGPRFVRLSPNWAAPVPLPGEPAFLTLTENRYVPISGTTKTASCFVRLSPNWAAPVPLPGEPAFLTLTENRYVPIPGTTKTASCSYIEHWDAQLQKIRYARGKAPAIFYGASVYRPGRTPPVVTIRQHGD